MKPEVKAAIAKENKANGVGKANTVGLTPTKETVVIDVTLPLGRPVDPNSDRQKRLAAYAVKAATEGTLHRGRPKNPDSANAKKQATRDARLKELQDKAVAAVQATGKTAIIAGSETNDINIEIPANAPHIGAAEIVEAVEAGKPIEEVLAEVKLGE